MSISYCFSCCMISVEHVKESSCQKECQSKRINSNVLHGLKQISMPDCFSCCMISVEHVKESSGQRECQLKGLWLWLAGRRAAPRRSRNVRQDAARAEGVVFRPAPPTVQFSRDSFLDHNNDTNAEGPDDGDQGKVCLPGSLLAFLIKKIII